MEPHEQAAAPPAAPGRGPKVVLAAGVAVVLALGGFVAGRTSGRPAGDDPAPSPSPQAQAFRGPTRFENGVPLGYAQSQEGAVAAAVNFAGVITSQRALDREGYTAAIRRISAPDAADAQVQKVEPFLESLEERKLPTKAELGIGVAIRYAPLAFQVAAFDGDTATVKVWGANVVGVEQESLPVAVWGTTTIRLRWVDGDWRMTDQANEPVSTVPQSVQQPSTTIAGLTPELGAFDPGVVYAVPSQ